MSTQQLEQEAVDRPSVNPWRQKPTPAQTRYATDLCKSELPYADRVATINSFPVLDSAAMSALIGALADVREQRMARLRRAGRRSRR